jgi:hypothetical protein
MPGFSTARQKMVDGQVRPSDVTDIRILDAMLAVPREAFVPANQRALAYLDLDLDVSEGAAAKRYLIKPVSPRSCCRLPKSRKATTSWWWVARPAMRRRSPPNWPGR